MDDSFREETKILFNRMVTLADCFYCFMSWCVPVSRPIVGLGSRIVVQSLP